MNARESALVRAFREENAAINARIEQGGRQDGPMSAEACAGGRILETGSAAPALEKWKDWQRMLSRKPDCAGLYEAVVKLLEEAIAAGPGTARDESKDSN